MKFLIAVVIILVNGVTAAIACVQKEWRGHKIFCYQNGPAVQRTDKNWIRTKETPPICQRSQSKTTANQFSFVKLNVVVNATKSYVPCRVYSIHAYFFFTKVARLIRCKKSENENELGTRKSINLTS